MLRTLNLRNASLVLALVFFAWLFVGPLVMLAIGAFRSSPLARNQSWTLSGLQNVLTDPQAWATLALTLQFALSVTILASVLAIFFATVVTQVDIPFRRWITPAMVALLAMPTVLYALSWSMLGAGPSSPIGHTVHALGLGAFSDLFDTRSWWGMVLVTTFKAVPLGYLIMLGAFRNQDASFLEASRVAGASRPRAFFEIQLPALAPAILAAALFLFIRAVEAFDIPAVLGMPAGITVYSTQIYTYLRGGFQADYPSAAVASLVIVVLVALLVLVQTAITGRGKSYTTVGGRGRPTMLESPPGPMRILLGAFLLAYIGVTILIPIVQVMVSAFQPFVGAPTYTLDNFATLLADRSVRNSLLNTLVVSTMGGALTVVLAVVVAYAFVRMKGWKATTIRLVSWVPAAMPGIVLSLAFLWLILLTPGVRTSYGTLIPLILGLGVATVPLALRTLEGPLGQIGKDLEESATTSGASRLRAIVTITLRLLAPSLISAWVLVTVNMSGILDVPILLSGTGTELVATMSFSFHNSGSTVLSAALYVIFTSILGGLLLILLALQKAVAGIIKARSRKLVESQDEHEGSSL